MHAGKKRLSEEEVDGGETDEDVRHAPSPGAMELRDSLVSRPMVQAMNRGPIATQDKARVQNGDLGQQYPSGALMIRWTLTDERY